MKKIISAFAIMASFQTVQAAKIVCVEGYYGQSVTTTALRLNELIKSSKNTSAPAVTEGHDSVPHTVCVTIND